MKVSSKVSVKKYEKGKKNILPLNFYGYKANNLNIDNIFVQHHAAIINLE